MRYFSVMGLKMPLFARLGKVQLFVLGTLGRIFPDILILRLHTATPPPILPLEPISGVLLRPLLMLSTL